MDVALDDQINDKAEIRKKTAKPLLWIGMVSITMMFAGLTSAVVVSSGSEAWSGQTVPGHFLYSTFVIVVSSFSFVWAIKGAKSNRQQQLKLGLYVTAFLGLTFGLLQFLAWSEMYENGVFFTGSNSNVAGSYLYILSGLHLAHLIGGLISLAVVVFNANRGLYGSNNLLGLQLSSTYWHFLDGLWIYLFLFLNYIN